MFTARQPLGLGHERCIEVAADQLDVVAEPPVCRKSTNDVAKPAADIDHPIRRRDARSAKGLQHWHKQQPHTVNLKKFLIQPLQLGVGATQNTVAMRPVEHPSRRRERGHVPRRARLAVLAEPLNHRLPLNIDPLERRHVVVDDEIRKFEELATH